MPNLTQLFVDGRGGIGSSSPSLFQIGDLFINGDLYVD